MSAIWFNSLHACSLKAPGEYATDNGYLYGIFWRDGEIKVGSSVNPRTRIGTAWSLKSKARVGIAHIGADHFERELAFHHVMKPCVLPGRREHYRPTVIDSNLQRDLTECQQKILEHNGLVEEYGGWVQVLSGNPEARLELEQDDYLFFFGT